MGYISITVSEVPPKTFFFEKRLQKEYILVALKIALDGTDDSLF